jgi:hypothetical protein
MASLEKDKDKDKNKNKNKNENKDKNENENEDKNPSGEKESEYLCDSGNIIDLRNDTIEKDNNIKKYHDIINLLLAGKDNICQKQVIIKENDIKMILNDVMKIFMEQSMLIEIDSPVHICADIHGQYDDLLKIFKKCGFPDQTNYLFLGDYVDRGKFSIETIILLFCYKIIYKDRFILLRGNHEAELINKIYGFYDDIMRHYNIRLFKMFTDVFNTICK